MSFDRKEAHDDQWLATLVEFDQVAQTFQKPDKAQLCDKKQKQKITQELLLLIQKKQKQTD